VFRLPPAAEAGTTRPGQEDGMKVRVWLHSKLGMWEFYDGYADVIVSDVSKAFEAACANPGLTLPGGGAFPERPASSWVLERIEWRAS
jgi:hypothetical protein